MNTNKKPLDEENDYKGVVGTYLTKEIKDKVQEDAKKNKRSISSQIAWIVEIHYNMEK